MLTDEQIEKKVEEIREKRKTSDGRMETGGWYYGGWFKEGVRHGEQTMIESACKAFEKELKQFQNLLVMIDKGYANFVDIQGSIEEFKKKLNKPCDEAE
jgi:hypothetical protein